VQYSIALTCILATTTLSITTPPTNASSQSKGGGFQLTGNTTASVTQNNLTGGGFTLTGKITAISTINPLVTAPCPGDTNKDNSVDLADLNAVLALFGQTTTSSADLDNSGAVDLQDLNILLSAFGESCTP
jgi:hypothetical protein